MKTLFAVFLFCWCLGGTASAAELSLAGGADASLTNPGLSEPAAASGSLPAAPDLASGTAWMGSGPPQTLTLDPPKSAPVLARLDLPLLTAPAGPGVPDSWVYAALGTMLLALVWACAGHVSGQRSAPLHTGGDQRSGSRTQRVHMLPLKP